jgi:hypothetical protein
VSLFHEMDVGISTPSQCTIQYEFKFLSSDNLRPEMTRGEYFVHTIEKEDRCFELTGSKVDYIGKRSNLLKRLSFQGFVLRVDQVCHLGNGLVLIG